MNALSVNDGVEVTMDCKEFLIVGGSAGTQVGTNEGNMVSLVLFVVFGYSHWIYSCKGHVTRCNFSCN